MKKRIQPIIIPHFRGLSDLRGRMLNRGYSPHLEGVIDRRGGNLNRLGGSISATSGPHASIWGIHQLQFQTGWNFAVNDGGHRKVYEQGLPWQGLHLGDYADWRGVPGLGGLGHDHPAPNFEHRDDGKNHDPRRHPSICHSWWDWRYGEWRYPITDFMLCMRSRGGGWTTSSISASTVEIAVDRAWDAFNGFPALADISLYPWGPWNPVGAGNRPLAPDHAFFTTYYPMCFFYTWWYNHPLGNGYRVYCGWNMKEYKVCSDLLGNPPTPPTGGEYDEAYFSAGGMAGGKIITNIGTNCVMCNSPPPPYCTDFCTDGFEAKVRMPSRGDIPDGDVPHSYDEFNHYLLYRDELPYIGTSSRLDLVSRGGVIQKHDEFCFGEK